MFDDRLENLRKELGYTQQEVADKIGIQRATYRTYEKNLREPDGPTLRKICKFFDVSSDYLIGTYKPPDEDTEIINRILPKLTAENKRAVRLFCEFVNSNQ